MNKQQAKEKRYTRMPMAELTTPHSGRVCLLNRYWMVTDEGEALFFRKVYPQCNSDRSIVERLMCSPGTRIEFVPVAYVPRIE